jgi:hypothetical protein
VSRRTLAALLASAALHAQAAAPDAVTPAADPLAACRLAAQAPRRSVSLGMPRAPFRLKATGDVRFAVLFVDFDDAPATMTPQKALAVVAPAADFIRTVSYGNMRLAFAPHYRWLRMSKPSTDYGMTRGTRSRRTRPISRKPSVSQAMTWTMVTRMGCWCSRIRP